MTNEFDKITPQTYIDMNKEFEEDDIAFRITVPTQEQIDAWKKQAPPPFSQPPMRDLVAEQWKEHRAKNNNFK